MYHNLKHLQFIHWFQTASLKLNNSRQLLHLIMLKEFQSQHRLMNLDLLLHMYMQDQHTPLNTGEDGNFSNKHVIWFRLLQIQVSLRDGKIFILRIEKWSKLSIRRWTTFDDSPIENQIILKIIILNSNSNKIHHFILSRLMPINLILKCITTT